MAGRLVLSLLQGFGLYKSLQEEITEVSSEALVSLAPPAVLFMSSALERKVSWCFVKGFEAVGQVVRPLIDAGLDAPQGLAYHAGTNALFVADFGQRKIFRYALKVQSCSGSDCAGLGLKVSVADLQRTIVEDVLAQYLSLDTAGNLYFADQGRNSICRVDGSVVQRLATRGLFAADLQRVAPAQATASQWRSGLPYIVELYTAASGSPVQTPAGVDTDGVRLAWGNMGGGSGGAVAMGAAEPLAGVGANASRVMSTAGVANAVAFTHTMVVYSTTSSGLWGVCNLDGRPIALSQGITTPSGLAWDGDGTMYVADSASSTVYTLPTGVCLANRPLRPAVRLHDVFGVALMRGTDPALAAVLGGETRNVFASLFTLS